MTTALADQRAAARRIDQALTALQIDVDSEMASRAIARARAELRLVDRALAADERARSAYDAIVDDVAVQAKTARLVGGMAAKVFGS